MIFSFLYCPVSCLHGVIVTMIAMMVMMMIKSIIIRVSFCERVINVRN